MVKPLFDLITKRTTKGGSIVQYDGNQRSMLDRMGLADSIHVLIPNDRVRTDGIRDLAQQYELPITQARRRNPAEPEGWIRLIIKRPMIEGEGKTNFTKLYYLLRHHEVTQDIESTKRIAEQNIMELETKRLRIKRRLAKLKLL